MKRRRSWNQQLAIRDQQTKKDQLVSRIICCKSPAGTLLKGSVVEFEKKSAVTNKEFSSWNFSKANPTADDLAKQFQQQRSSSDNSAAMQNQQQRKFSRGDFIFSTIQVPLREARFFVQKASPWKFEKIPHAYKEDFAQ
ncbi:hypothetical protein F511_22434 [Dorcoceras hygrometricum]|uniref:Uncharacterized protein n=1 Tax=Dorcoceras hygrometricum TaxID=472368 RepID=A0A2Z7AZG9_9LAMI|nr:hypothetical protein F511_22434 [Dorcoceras hygrometricum]